MQGVTSLLSSLGAGGVLLFFIKRHYDKKDKERAALESELAAALEEFHIGMDYAP